MNTIPHLTLLLVVAIGTTLMPEVLAADKFRDFADLFPRIARSGSGRVTDEAVSPVLRETMSSLRQLLHFFLRNTQEINLDGVIGTRIVDGQLTVLLKRVLSSPQRYPENNSGKYLEREIESLALLAKDISTITIEHLKINSKKYFSDIGLMLADGFWEFNYPTRETNQDYVYPVVFAEEVMNETQSDFCISEMLGSGPSARVCSITDNCWDVMTRPLYSKYSLTHQIIYLQTGESTKCDQEMQAKIMEHQQESVGHLQDIYCANVYREMKENAAEGLPERRRDLFMEQAAICGMLGYRDLFRISWLKEILSWQQPEGCYGKARNSVERPRRIKRADGALVKRNEKELKDGCLSHKSAVAASALALYIRYLVEDPTLGGATTFTSRPFTTSSDDITFAR